MAETISLLGRTWVTNLWWQCLSSAKSATKETQAIIDTLNVSSIDAFDSFVLLPGEIYQAGFAVGAQDSSGNLTKDPSLAASILKAVGTTATLLYITNTTSAYVFAAKDGVIFADGDFYGKKEDARRLFQSFQEFTWDSIIENEYDSFDEFERVFRDILGEPKKVFRLQSPEISYMLLTWIFTITLILSIIIASASWKILSKKRTKHSLAPLILGKKDPVATDVPKPIVPEYISVSDTLQTCQKAFNTEELITSGWELAQWACSGTGEVFRLWNSTSNSDFLHLPYNSKFVISDPNKVQLISPSAVENTKMKILDSEVLPTEQELFALLRKIAKESFGEVSVIAPSSASAENKLKDLGTILLTNGSARVLSWTITTEVSPFISLKRVQKLPGLGISKFAWDISSGKWKIQGDAYVKAM